MRTRKTDGQGREFWIEALSIVSGKFYFGHAYGFQHPEIEDIKEPIHVIEFNAHKAALDRLDAAEKVIDKLSAALEMIHKTPPVTDTEILINKCAFDALKLISKWKGEK